MCANMEIYNKVKTVPENAKKPIQAGRLKGKTDINPMWRIKMLTEIFGICGIGWKTTIDRTWLDIGANGEQIASVQISLYVRDPETKEWGDAIVGIGGAMFVANEKSGPFTDDECYKKAYTDAISVACKALGFAADVYYEKDSSKYDPHPQTNSQQVPPVKQSPSPSKQPSAPAPAPSGVPFPEAEGFNAASSQKRDPAELVKPKEDVEKMRAWALAYKVEAGAYAGKTLGELRKADRAAFEALSARPTGIECAKAITIINEWIAEASGANK